MSRCHRPFGAADPESPEGHGPGGRRKPDPALSGRIGPGCRRREGPRACGRPVTCCSWGGSLWSADREASDARSSLHGDRRIAGDRHARRFRPGRNREASPFWSRPSPIFGGCGDGAGRFGEPKDGGEARPALKRPPFDQLPSPGGGSRPEEISSAPPTRRTNLRPQSCPDWGLLCSKSNFRQGRSRAREAAADLLMRGRRAVQVPTAEKPIVLGVGAGRSSGSAMRLSLRSWSCAPMASRSRPFARAFAKMPLRGFSSSWT